MRCDAVGGKQTSGAYLNKYAPLYGLRPRLSARLTAAAARESPSAEHLTYGLRRFGGAWPATAP